MKKLYPAKLKSGDEVRIIAPSRSMGIISRDSRGIADKRFSKLGLKLSFGQHVDEIDDFTSSSVDSRIADLHTAFGDQKVKAVLTVIGGFNSNQLLKFIDWELIRANPKIFCGFSDITALNNSIFSKTGLVTYSGPHYSTFGQKLYFDYTLDYFIKCLMSDTPFDIKPSDSWSDDLWFRNQDDRKLIPNPGWQVIRDGEAAGTILGANLCTFNLLQGTEYFPDLSDSILFIEDDGSSNPLLFDRDLQSLVHQPGFSGVKGLVIGRFQTGSDMAQDKLAQILKTKKELNDLPIVTGVDFGHSDLKITFPIGGEVKIELTRSSNTIQIIKH